MNCAINDCQPFSKGDRVRLLVPMNMYTTKTYQISGVLKVGSIGIIEDFLEDSILVQFPECWGSVSPWHLEKIESEPNDESR